MLAFAALPECLETRRDDRAGLERRHRGLGRVFALLSRLLRGLDRLEAEAEAAACGRGPRRAS